MRARSWRLAMVAAWFLVLSSCGDGGTGQRTEHVVVYAASSLTDAFTTIARAFEAAHPTVSVEVNYAGSSALATQIEQGAPADVFASADQLQLQRLTSLGLAYNEQVFATNTLMVVMPITNPARIEGVRDLARSGVKLILYADDLPIGRYAREAIHNLARDLADPAYEEAVLANVVSRESNVRSALTKVEIGEADASVVYRTDGARNAHVRTIEIPPAANVTAEYPIALVGSARQRANAEAFVAFVLGTEGQRILREAGFEAAP